MHFYQTNLQVIVFIVFYFTDAGVI